MSVTVNGVTFTGDPCRVVETTFNGRYVKAGEATMAHLFDTDEWMRRKHGCWVYVIQSAYNTSVPASAGTHDYDKSLDVLVISKRGRRKWATGQRWLRQRGWADWWRHTGSWYRPSSWHHHMVSLTWLIDHCKVGIFVPGQISDYCAEPPRNGLSGHPVDPTWHPENIRSTIFNFDRWYRKQVEDMGYADWSQQDKDAFWADFDKRAPKAVWDAPVNSGDSGGEQFDGMSFRRWAKDLWNKTVGR